MPWMNEALIVSHTLLNVRTGMHVFRGQLSTALPPLCMRPGRTSVLLFREKDFSQALGATSATLISWDLHILSFSRDILSNGLASFSALLLEQPLTASSSISN